MKRIIIYPYKMGSASAKKIQEELKSQGFNAIRVRKNGTYRPRDSDVVINWGSTQEPSWNKQKLNKPLNVATSVNKITALQKLLENNISVPEFTTDINTARTWNKIVARTLTRSSGGNGIVICRPDRVIRAPLYTKFIDKDNEYRVHVFNGEVVDYSKKVATNGKKDVCSHNNGYVFVRNVEHIEDNKQLAISAVRALGLDFGAVDIIRKDGVSYVLEVNTAPGLEQTTLSTYVNAIKKHA